DPSNMLSHFAQFPYYAEEVREVAADILFEQRWEQQEASMQAQEEEELAALEAQAAASKANAQAWSKFVDSHSPNEVAAAAAIRNDAAAKGQPVPSPSDALGLVEIISQGAENHRIRQAIMDEGVRASSKLTREKDNGATFEADPSRSFATAHRTIPHSESQRLQ